MMTEPSLRLFPENELALCFLPWSSKAEALIKVVELWPVSPENNYAVRPDYKIPLLVLYMADHSNIELTGWVGFDFFADEAHQNLADQLTRDYPSLTRSIPQNYVLQLSGSVDASNIKPSNEVISTLFNALLIYNRPLQYYGCTFYLPVYADKPLSPEELEASEHYQINKHTYENASSAIEAQAYLYFQPPLRDFLFDTHLGTTPPIPIKEWHLQPTDLWFLQLEDRSGELNAVITEVVLYQYFNNLCVLTVSVGLPIYTLGFQEHWWHDQVFADAAKQRELEQLRLGVWLGYTKLARLLFASFVAQKKEGKIARIVLKAPDEKGHLAAQSRRLRIEPIESKLATHPISYLLKCFFGLSKSYFDKTFHHFYDDRLFVNVVYGYGGKQFSKQTADKVFSLALYVDAPGDTWPTFGGYAYEPEFVHSLLARDSSPRWHGLGTYAGFTNYANAYLGQSDFFCKEIAGIHVPYLYGRMLLLTLFYQASLRHYREKLMILTSRRNCQINLDEVQKLRKEFMLFTNAYWFREVTSQIQGREVFTMQQQALELQRDYEFIKEEMERLDAYMQGQLNNELNKSSHQLNRSSLKLNKMVFVFAAISLLFSFTQIVFDNGILSQSKNWIFKLGFPERLINIARWLVPNVQGITLFVSILAFVAIVSFLIKRLISWLFKRKAN